MRDHFLLFRTYMNPSSGKAPSTLSLRYLLRAPTEDYAHPPVIIMLHGYGSNEADLLGLADDIPTEFLVISARAPLVLTHGQYAWFSLDYSRGVPVGDKQEAEAGRLLIKRFIDEVIEKFHADPLRVYLLGFSQGAMLSLSVALTFPPLVSGVVALSGRVLKEVKPLVCVTPELKKLKIFLGHGTEDTVLPIRFAHDARGYLEELGVDLAYHEYAIAHSISREEQADVTEWLRRTTV